MDDFKIMLIIAAGMAGMLLLFWLVGPNIGGGLVGAGMLILAARSLKGWMAPARPIFYLCAIAVFFMYVCFGDQIL